MERTPSGAISRSKTSIAKRAEKIREAAKADAQREARHGRTLQERSVQARARHYGLTAQQAASHHAGSVEGRMHLKGKITRVELLALEHYKRVLVRFGRDAGTPTVGQSTLARYQTTEPRAIAASASGAAVSLSQRHYDAAESTLQRAGSRDGTPVAWAISRVIRHDADLPPVHMAAFLAGVVALVAHFRLGTDPDRNAAIVA